MHAQALLLAERKRAEAPSPAPPPAPSTPRKPVPKTSPRKPALVGAIEQHPAGWPKSSCVYVYMYEYNMYMS
ncbi:MAG: hypothetical protein ACPIOQ_70850 [Promethearchaeia archaeon]